MDGRTTVAITGVSGYLGQALLPYLEQDTEMDRVIGMDIQLVASNEKIKGLGWTPQYTTAEALEALLAHDDRGSF